MSRAIFAVLGGFFGWFISLIIISYLGILTIGVDRAYIPDTYSTTTLGNGVMLFGGVFGAMVGGWLCRFIAKRPGPVLFLAMVIVGFNISDALTKTIAQSSDSKNTTTDESAIRTDGEELLIVVSKSKFPMWVLWGNVFFSGIGVLVGGGRPVSHDGESTESKDDQAKK